MNEKEGVRELEAKPCKIPRLFFAVGLAVAAVAAARQEGGFQAGKIFRLRQK